MLKRFKLFFLKCFIVFICFLLVGSPPVTSYASEGRSLSGAGLTGREFEDQVRQYIGIPYRRGGKTEKGLDCSGFVQMIYKELFGIALPHNSAAQFKFRDLKTIPLKDLDPGDLVFFSNREKRIDHVGVYLSGNRFIHASSSEGIRINSMEDKYWKNRFVGTKRHPSLILNAEPSDSVRFEASLEIPIHERGTLFGYRQDDFLLSRPGLEINPAFRSFNSCDSISHFHEIGYTYSVSGDLDINLSAMHEDFNVMTAWHELDTATGRVVYQYDEFSYERADRFGVRLSGAFQPSPWFSITPSVTYFDYSSHDEDIANAPSWLLCLNTALLPEDRRWSLSMLLQYSEKEDTGSMTDSPFNRFSSFDMAIRLGISVTDNIQFSIMGRHDRQTTFSGRPGDAHMMNTENNDLTMTFDFSY